MKGRTRFVIAGFGNVDRQIASLIARDASVQLEIAAVAGAISTRQRSGQQKPGSTY